ncbi:hypothetical protein ACFLQ6_10880 [Thermoproteota archaeon]
MRNTCDWRIGLTQKAVGGFNQRFLIFVYFSTELEAWTKMRIEKAEDAESVVRKYFLGTRTQHGKINSLSTESETKGPDEKGLWKIKGFYVTEADVREEFTATVSSRGEVLITSSGKQKPPFG